MNCVLTLAHLHYTSHTFQGNHQSLQWNVCAHVNIQVSAETVSEYWFHKTTFPLFPEKRLILRLHESPRELARQSEAKRK